MHRLSLPGITRGALLFAFLSACGQGAVAPSSEGGAMPATPDLQSITAGVVRHELDNGLTLLVRPVPTAGATALVTRVKTGYFHEPDELTGISHVVEHMFFNGTPTRPDPEQISREIKSLGGMLNAATAYDHTTYYTVVPTRNWRAAMQIQADALQNPLFDGAVLEKEMGAIKQEARRKLDSPMAYGREKMFALAHEKHRIRRWRIGTEDVLDGIDRDALVRWYEDHYRPSNTILTVAGDVDPQEVISAVEQLYGGMEVGHLRQRGGPGEGRQEELRYERINGELRRAYLFVGFHGPGVGHDDNAALDVLATILGTGRAGRLSQRLRDDLGAVTGVSASSWQYEDMGLFEITASCDPLNLEMSTRELFVELERLRHFGPTEGEMARARKILITGQAFDLEEVLGQANTLAAYEADGSYLDYDRENSELLAVTADDVSEVLDRYLQADQASVLEYVPWGFKSPATAAEMRAHIDGILVAAARDFGPPVSPGQAPGLMPVAERDQWQQKIQAAAPYSAGVHSFDLPTGGSLVVHENPTAPTCTAGVWFRGGRITELSSNSGITQLLVRVMTRETLNRSQEQLAREIEALGSGLGFSVQDDWFGFHVAGLATELPNLLDILTDAVRSPSISEDAVVDELRLRKPAVQGVEDQSAAYTMDLTRGLLYGEHPYGLPMQGLLTGLLGLNRELVEEFYFDQVRPESMVIVVSGNVKADVVAPLVTAFFEDWDLGYLPLPGEAAAYYTTERLREPVISPADPMRMAERLRSQSTIVASWPTVPRLHEDRAALTVLAEITGGMGGTFFEEIRTRRGLAYQVSTFNSNRMLAGEFSVFVACTPDSTAAVQELVMRLTRALAHEPPGAEQLARAKASLTGSWEIGGQTNAARARRLATLELAGQPLSDIDEWPGRIEAVTLEDLQRVAAKWLDRDPVATGVLMGNSGASADPR